MRQTESVRLIPAKKGLLLFAFLLLFVANALKAQEFDNYDRFANYYSLIGYEKSVKEVNHFRLFVAEPNNNADSVIDVVAKYDSIMLYGKLKLIANVIFEGDDKIRYCFSDSNTKYIETTFYWEDSLTCVKIYNPYHLVCKENDTINGRLISEYKVYQNEDYTLKIKKKVYENSIMTIVEKRRLSKRFPSVDILYFNDKLSYIDFYEAKY